MDLAELSVKIVANAEGVKSGIDMTKKQLKGLVSSSQETEKALNSLGIGGTVAIASITLAVKKGIDEFNKYTSTMNGLASQMAYIGEDIGTAMDIVKEKSKDGLMTESDVAKSIKNLTTYGMTLEQASLMVDRLKDSASTNREAHYSLSEAVRVTTEGIKNENSMLSDAAGVTKNMAKMVEDYAKSIGKTKESLTQVEKAQAIFMQTMQETGAVVGNASKHAETLGGAMDEASASSVKLSQAFGGAMSDSIKDIVKTTILATNGLTEFINENKGLVAGTTSSVTALSLLVAGFVGFKKAVELVKIAMVGLNVSMGGFLPIALGISAVVGIFVAIKSAINETKEAEEALIEKQKELNELIQIETSVDNYEKKADELRKLTDAREAYVDMVKQARDANLQLSETDMNEWAKKYNTSVEELNETLDLFDATLIDSILKNDQFKEALSELDNAILTLSSDVESFDGNMDFDKQTLMIDEQVKAVDKLRKAYEDIQDGEELKRKDINELIELYPKLAEYLDATGDAYFKNGELIQEVIEDVSRAEMAHLQESKDIAQENITRKQNEIEAIITANKKLEEEMSKGVTGTKEQYDENIGKLEEMRLELESLEQAFVLAGAKVNLFNANLAQTNSNMEYKQAIDDVQALADMYTTLADGERLAYDDMANLIALYPEIAKYLAETNDYTLQNGEILKSVGQTAIDVANAKMRANKEELDLAITNARIMLEAEKEKYKGMINAANAYYSVAKISLNATMQMDKYLEKTPEKIGEMESALSSLEKQSASVDSAIDKINNIGFSAGSGKSAGGSGAGSKTAKIKEEITEYEKQIKLMEDAKKLSEMTHQEEFDRIESIKNAQILSDKDVKDSKERLYALTRDISKQTADDYINAIKEMNTGNAETTDFASISNAIAKAKDLFFEEFKEYPKTMQHYLDILYDLDVNASEKRSSKVTEIERNKVDEVLKQYDRQMEYYRAMNGLKMADGEVFNYTYIDELADMNKKVLEVTTAIDGLLATYNGDITAMNETSRKFYNDLIKMRDDYHVQMQLIDIKGQKKAQADAEKAIKDAEKAEKDKLKAVESANKEKLKIVEDYYKRELEIMKTSGKKAMEELKNHYAEQIELLKGTSDAEVAIYEERLNALDKLMKEEDKNDRNEQLLDKINRAKEQLKYEVSESNKYELNKDIEKMQSEYEKNNRKDSIEDEKDKLKEQIQAIKDHNADKIKNLEALRDVEIKQAEESLALEIDILEQKMEQQRIYYESGNASSKEYYEMQSAMARAILEEQKLANGESTVNFKENLMNREEGDKKSYIQREKFAESNTRNTREIMERGTNKILLDLFNHISDFAAIGKRHGEIYAAAFGAASSGGLMMSMAYEREQVIMGMNLPSSMRSYTTNMTFNTPVATPSMVSRETEEMLRNISRLD